MANPLRGEVDLPVGDKTYTLRLSMNSLAEIETVLDTTFPELSAQLADPKRSVRVGTWRALLWGALRGRHKDTTLEQAGEIMTEIGLAQTVNVIGQVMAAAFPSAKGGEAENPQPAGL